MVEAEETLQSLAEDERRALRASKFAPLPLPPSSSSRSQPRLAHPSGPMTTNKAAALAKFLERKLQHPDGLNSLDPNLVELAVKNAKETVVASKGMSSTLGSKIRHVASFEDSVEMHKLQNLEEDDDKEEEKQQKKRKKNKKKKKTKATQSSKAHKTAKRKKPKL
ncbi:nucleolar protein 56 isoform X1 [Musa acuminata AAA Group]|uniref:nucleolar protein 56 isoform X1 n=1 Tax=Musa acuminata AAA Group TaxID=214697 RepID=UPI0031E3C907